MSLRQFLSTNRNADADRNSQGNTSNITTAPPYTLSGRDSLREHDKTESCLTDTLGVAKKSKVATTNYIYYRTYAEDGAIPSKTPVAAGDPFLGRIKAKSVPPPHTAETVKRSIAKVENIKDRTSTTLFLTPYSQSPVDDEEKVTILNGTGPGSTPQEPLALVAKMSDSERSALESDGRSGLASAAESDTTSPEIRYVYYLLYADDYEIPSKVAFDPEEPSLGRIRANSVAPPHSSASIKRCISRVEGNPALVWNADLFTDMSCDTPLKGGHISLLPTDGPGLSPNEPMAIVQRPPFPDGKYLIKKRAADVYWNAWYNPITKVHLHFTPMDSSKTNTFNQVNIILQLFKCSKDNPFLKWNITQDTTNGNISMRSVAVPSSWVGADMTGSTVPVPWRMIPADSKSYYLTTDMNRTSQNPRVPADQEGKPSVPVPMATLKEGDKGQMWEFIRI